MSVSVSLAEHGNRDVTDTVHGKDSAKPARTYMKWKCICAYTKLEDESYALVGMQKQWSAAFVNAAFQCS